MTFKKFVFLLAKYRPDALVESSHGEYGGLRNKTNGVPICFVNGGEISKVYEFRGSYYDILRQLGCNVMDKKEKANRISRLAYCIKNNNVPDEFGFVNNYNGEIKLLKERLEATKDYEIV